MLIDWFTVAAQLINFLILVWLMQRFLYKPILDAIDAREQGIVKRLADAKSTEEKALKEHEEYKKKNKMFEQEHAALLGKVAEEVEAERKRRLKEVNEEADSQATKWQEALSNETRKFNQSLGRRIQDEVFSISRKALMEMANVKLESQVADVFICRLHALSGETKNELATMLTNSSKATLIRSALELDPPQQKLVHQALQEVFDVDTKIRFETSPDLISGIELVVNDHKVAWSIDTYLASVKQEMADLLKAKVL